MHDEIDDIRKNANIVSVISSYIPLTQKGKNYFGVCPFHEDHSPSMSVSEEKQIYKCFSCGASGNVFTFVKDYENVSFLEAVKIVADKCGLIFNNVNIKKEKKQTKEYEIMDLALKYYQNNLNTSLGGEAKEYLNNRCLDDKTIKDFEIGLALDNKHSLYELLLKKNYGTETLINLGLIKQSEDGLNDIFINRIIFPIHNLDGDVVGFTGRIYHNEDKNIAKYMNTKESVIFKKGEILFNYHRAKKAIIKAKEVIVVEGNMDAIRLYASGIQNVVALMGTSLTKQQVNILKSMRAKIILMFDNDEAGEIATFQNGNILMNNNINPYVVRLSGEKDPDSYIIKNGKEAIINNIKNPISFFDFKLKYLKKNKDLTKTEDLVNFIKEILNSMKDIDDVLTKEVTIKKISEEYNISIDILKEELKKIQVPKKVVTPSNQKKRLSRYDKACEIIIYYMMNDKKYIDRFQKELGFINNKNYRNIANEIIYYGESYGDIDISSFLTFIGVNEELDSDVKEILKDINITDLKMNDFTEYINVANEEMTKKEITNLKEQIKVTLDENKKDELANKIIELKKGCVGYEK